MKLDLGKTSVLRLALIGLPRNKPSVRFVGRLAAGTIVRRSELGAKRRKYKKNVRFILVIFWSF